MKTLIVKYQLVPVGGWMGPCRPIIGTYPLWAAPHIGESEVARLIAGYETPHRIVVDHRVHDDGLSEAEYEQRQAVADRAEWLRTTPGGLS